MLQDFVFTSESVTEGHPDKLCDQVADAILDRFLQQDAQARLVAECAVAEGILFVAARFASSASVDIPDVARQVITQAGYEREDFNARTCTVMTSLSELRHAPDVESALDPELVPAHNMANCFGYACSHNAAMLPQPLWLAHKLARRLSTVRLQRQVPYLAPDGKTQVSVEFRQRRPVRIHSISLLASQWGGDAPTSQHFRDALFEHVVEPVFLDEEIRPDRQTLFFVNPEGPYVVGGPSRHSGLTGRKTGMDTYGEFNRHADAALSGKDPGRIDRVGVYAARYAAKNVVASGMAEECEVALTYSIGQAQPVSVQVDSKGSGRLPDIEIAARVQRCFDFRPGAIVRRFNLRQLPTIYRGGFYRRLAAYGHVGRMDIGLPWELSDRAEALRD